MSKYYQVAVSKEEDEIEFYTEELTFYNFQCWIMDLIRLDTRDTLQKIFNQWQVFDFAEDEDEGYIEFVWHEQWENEKSYYYFVYANNAEEAEYFLLKYLIKNGFPRE